MTVSAGLLFNRIGYGAADSNGKAEKTAKISRISEKKLDRWRGIRLYFCEYTKSKTEEKESGGDKKTLCRSSQIHCVNLGAPSNQADRMLGEPKVNSL